jgi:hypothetical protein
MVSVTSLAPRLQTLFTTTANRRARETKCVQRQTKCTGAILAQTLVFGWLDNPAAPLSGLCDMAASAGITITPQGLDQRFTPALAACLEQVVQDAVAQVVAADPVAIPLLERFAGGVWLEDCSVVSLPPALADRWRGCGSSGEASHAALKLGVRLDLCCGQLHGPVLAAGHLHDRAVSDQQPPLLPESLRITDLGFFGQARFAALAAQGVLLLSRPQAGTLVLDEQGRRWDIPDLLEAQGTDRVDLPIRLGARAQVPCRLVAVRVSAETAAARRRAIRQDAKREGQTPTRSRLGMADWNVYVTTAPGTLLSVDEALVLMRARWQIELLFKLWKHYGGLARSRSANPDRILCEVYAKLLAMVVQHWIMLTTAWAYPDRSLPRLLAVVRKRATALVEALASGRGLHALLQRIRPHLTRAVPINARRKHPNTYALLLDPSRNVLP